MNEVYKQLPYDLSGSRSKNRFRNEMLWGLERMFEIYKTGEEFCMVFDYACDIELHLETGFEFYQLKTSNKGSAYTVKHIIKTDEAGHSILGKIYILKHKLKDYKEVGCKIALVVNTPLSAGKIYSSVGELEFIDLDDDVKTIINSAIKNELKLKEDINMDNVFYFHSSMDLANPQDSIIGKTVQFFVDISGEEPKKVITLFRLLQDAITMCASYELECKDINELHQKKGITRKQFDMMIRKYIDNADEAVIRAKKMIEDYYPEFGDRVSMKHSLSKIVQEVVISKTLHNLQNKIADYIIKNIGDFNDELGISIKILLNKFSSEFPIEYSLNEKQAYFILIFAKLEEGLYEDINN